MKILLSDYDEKTQKEILEMYDNYQFLKSYDLKKLIIMFINSSIDAFYEIIRKKKNSIRFTNIISSLDVEYNYLKQMGDTVIDSSSWFIFLILSGDIDDDGDDYKKNCIKDYKKIIFNFIKEENIKITKKILDKLFISDISNYIFSYLI